MYSHTVILGRITKDPELKQTGTGISVTSFSVAVDRNYIPKGGERKSDFFEIVAWRGTAEFICRNFKKGEKILVEGAMESRKYVDKSGANRIAWELVATNIKPIESKGKTLYTSENADNNAKKILEAINVNVEDDVQGFETAESDMPF